MIAFILPLAAYASNTIWSNSAVPTTASVADNHALELGVKFRSDVSGSVTGLRFYKGSTNTGTHVGHLWTSTGKLLASATFTSETASGWQQVSFATPIAITANTVFVASYYAPHGNYALSRPYFTKSYDNAPLHAIADGTSGHNGIYFYPGSGFPTGSYQQSNYWVDVVFNPTTATSTSTATVASVSPSSGPISGGNVVTITGTNFKSGSSVSFGGTNSTAVTLISATQINAMAPAHSVGLVNLTVANSGGSSATMWSCYAYSSVPTIGSISPNAGPVTGGTSVTILGTGFKSGARVSFGALLAISTSVISSTQIQAVTPAETAGTVNVTVQNTDASKVTASSAFSFFASTSAPTVSGISPNSNIAQGGATATVTGANFAYGATVTFGSTPASMVSLVSSKQLNVVVPPGTAGTIVSVAVTNPNGQKATLSNAFRYGKVLFQDNFESGNFSAWNALLNQTDNVVQSSLVHSGTHAARVHYSLAASTTHRDSNRWFQKQFSQALTHYFLRGYVYHQTPVSSSDPKAQRKLFYGKETVNGGWDNVLVSYGMQLSYHNSPPQDGCFQTGDNKNNWSLFPFSFDTWYSVEMEVQLNSPCKHDGVVNVWVNGRQVAHLTAQNIRGGKTDGLGDMEIGNQLDTNASGALNEYRYWDDIVFADAYITP